MGNHPVMASRPKKLPEGIDVDVRYLFDGSVIQGSTTQDVLCFQGRGARDQTKHPGKSP